MISFSKFTSVLLFFTGTFITSLMAQNQDFQAPAMPVDEETKLVSYSEVEEVKNVNKTELYKRALNWFSTYYKNPNDVIREKDSVNFKIVGKPRFKITGEPNEKGVKMDAGYVQYTITVTVKDGRYKYEITQINWKQQSYYGIEKWIEQKDRYKVFHFYLYQTDDAVKEAIESLEKAMETAPKQNNKDNW